MKVQCVRSNFLAIEDDKVVDRLRKYLRLSDGQLPIKKDMQYVVYGILFRDNSPWYYICLNDRDVSPTPYPAELFNVINDRMSEHWRLRQTVLPSGQVSSSLVFSEWASDPGFLEELIEGAASAKAIFSKYKAIMDAEFSD